jgi:predicted nucleotidyltransferase
MKPESFQGKILANKYLPKPIKFLIIIIANWVFHGFLYMEKTEKAFFLIFDLLLFFPLWFFLSFVTNLLFSALGALLVAHTIHWLFDGHIYVMLKNLGRCKTPITKFSNYTNGLSERAKHEKSIFSIIAFGSLSRNEFSDSSDLDLRIVRKPGLVNGIRACSFTLLERGRALVDKFPLDVYTLDSPRNLSKMSPDEPPIIIYNSAR